jgi:hypothetical protein
VEHSGIGQLVTALEEHFGSRAEVLKARSGLATLRSGARRLAVDDPVTAGRMESRAEEIESASTELGELRLWQLVTSGQAELSDEEVEEVRLLVAGLEPWDRLGIDPGCAGPDLVRAAGAAVERWRAKAGHPLTNRSTQEVSELVARSLEHIHTQLREASVT